MKPYLLVGLLLAGSAVAPVAAVDRMPLDEVQVGMTGVGVTVFEGTAREEFSVHILGVLRNINGPHRNLILARLEGGPLGRTGVIAGMSGSPVYVDDRLIGAVSYALGSFTTEPIAGITPIDEMIDAVPLPLRRAAVSPNPIELPMTPARLVAALRASLRPASAFAARAADVTARGASLADAQHAATLLRPIATPLVLGGFESETAEWLATTLRSSGLSPVLGTAQAADGPSTAAEPLQAGDAVGVALVEGDLSIAGTGTVTMIEDDRVYAFGHPFQNLGPTQFVMNRAHVHTLLPSLLSSIKIATVGEAIGTFEQDRLTAIAGTLGDTPAMIPVDITLRSTDDRRPLRRIHFDVVHDQVLTPLLAYVTVLNTLRAYERDNGAATLRLSGTATLDGHAPLTFDDVFAGNAPALGAATSVLTPITVLAQNPFTPVTLESLALDIVASETDESATIERIWLDDARVRAGRTASLKILTRSHRGTESIRTLPIPIPANAPSTLTLLVSGGPQLAQRERQELQGTPQPRSLGQLIRLLNDAPRSNRLYVRLLAADAGAYVGGERLVALPPSTLAVYQADLGRGATTPLRQAILEEWELESSEAITGSRLLTLRLGAR